MSTIKLIHPDLNNVKLLLITPNQSMIDHPLLIKQFYNKHSEDPYCTSCETNTLFTNALGNIGYNLDDISDISFNDLSII